MPDAAAPDYAEPILGWRVWRVRADANGLRLLSAVRDDVWPLRRELVARCDASALQQSVARHSAPAPACACGLHAAREPQLAARYLVGRDDSGVVARVIGLAALWGSVIECERGWRAERAYPAALWVPSAYQGVADELAAYGVPVWALESSRAAAVVDELSARA